MSPVDLDALTPDAVRSGVLAGVPVTVLGLARTGVGLARFFVDAGAIVTIYDGKPAADLADRLAELGGRSVRLVAGPEADPASAWEGAALVAYSPSLTPGFPTTEPRLRAALDALAARVTAGDPDAPALVSEPDLVLRLCTAPTIGVTGTKGKTTTASLIAHLLAADPAHPVLLGGNIGVPLVDRLAGLTPAHRVVVELSELQLPSLSRGTTVAVYTNVTADHLDRHGSLAAYQSVKRRLAELVEPAGALVLNLDDPVVAAYAALGTAPSVCYRLDHPVPGGVGIVDGWVVAAGVERLPVAGGGVAWTGPAGRVMPVAELTLPGRHNLANLLAAVSVGLLFGLAPDAIRTAAATFTGVEHRLEPVGLVDGVRFVNDSMGTQPDAVAAALRSFEAPLVLIAGGRDKGVDLRELAPVVAERAAAAVLIGESGPALAALFRAAGLRRVEEAGTLEAAVPRADALARELLADAAPGTVATVLLSPAAASFDQFPDYAARGRAFKAAVAGLAASATAGRDRGRAR
ncbi:MAG TPA: UDP-N-acetylmuramoyl-L-alanine--D-glutamate ligase [Candidatus Limnocylindrales bacterium]